MNPDQTGFIPDGQSSFNTSCVLNLVYSSKWPHDAVIYLDAQQAFDQVERRYMFAALKKNWFWCEMFNSIKDASCLSPIFCSD